MNEGMNGKQQKSIQIKSWYWPIGLNHQKRKWNKKIGNKMKNPSDNLCDESIENQDL